MLDKKTMEFKSQMRQEVMGAEEVERAERYLDLYRSAYKAKNNLGEIERPAVLESYYQGTVNTPKNSTEPGSNTNFIQSNIEGQVSLMMSEQVGVEAIPREPGDAEFQADVEDVLEFVLEKNKPELLLERATRRLGKFGTQAFMTLYDPEWEDGFGLPVIKTINTAYFYPDPNITDINDFQEGEYCILVANKSIFWARTQFDEDLVEAIMPGYNPNGTEIFGENDGEVDDISQENYQHIYLFIKEINDDDEVELKLIQMSGCGVILSDSSDGVDIEDEDGNVENIKTKFPKNIFPIFPIGLYERLGSFWALGDIDILIDPQNLVNEIDDQIRINGRLAGNPQILVEEGAGVDVRRWTNQGGLRVMVKDLDKIRQFPAQEMSQTIVNRRNQTIFNERNLLSRFSDQQVGLSQRGVESATEALQLQESGSNTTDFKKKKIQTNLSQALAYALELIKEYWTEEKVIRLTRDGAVEYKFFNAGELKEAPVRVPAGSRTIAEFNNAGLEAPQTELLTQGGEIVTKEAAFDVSVNIGAGTPKNKAFILQTLNELAARGAMTPQEYRKSVVKLLKLPIDMEMQIQAPQAPQGDITSSAQAVSGQFNTPSGTGITNGGAPGSIGNGAF